MCEYKDVCETYKYDSKTCDKNPMNYCTQYKNFKKIQKVNPIVKTKLRQNRCLNYDKNALLDTEDSANS